MELQVPRKTRGEPWSLSTVYTVGLRMEKGMATHSSIPAWETPWTEEPGGLQSMGKRVGT